MNDTIEVAEKLYYEINPTTKMDVPSSIYEKVEQLDRARISAESDLNLYDWCKLKLNIK